MEEDVTEGLKNNTDDQLSPFLMKNLLIMETTYLAQIFIPYTNAFKNVTLIEIRVQEYIIYKLLPTYKRTYTIRYYQPSSLDGWIFVLHCN